MNNIIFTFLMSAFLFDTLFGKTSFGIVGFTPLNLVLFLSIIVLLSVSVTRSGGAKVKIAGLPYVVVIFLSVLISLLYVVYLSSLTNLTIVDALREAKSFVFEPILLYILAFLLVQSRKQGTKYLAIAVSVIGILNAITLAAMMFNVTVFVQYEIYVDSGRFAGFTGNPNRTAYVLILAIVFQYYFMKLYYTRLAKLFFASLMLGSVFTILVTGSRGGLLGLVFLTIFLAYIWKDYKRLLILPAIILPIVVLVLVAGENEYILTAWERIASLGSGDTALATSGRANIWSALLDTFAASGMSVFLGLGFGVTEFIGLYAPAHNIYMRILIEFGVLGIIFWFTMVVAGFRYIGKLRVVDRPMELLRRSVQAGAYLVLLAWMFTTMAGTLQLVVLVLGLSVAVLSYGVEKKPKRRVAISVMS